jgi:hypothetical protein
MARTHSKALRAAGSRDDVRQVLECAGDSAALAVETSDFVEMEEFCLTHPSRPPANYLLGLRPP